MSLPGALFPFITVVAVAVAVVVVVAFYRQQQQQRRLSQRLVWRSLRSRSPAASFAEFNAADEARQPTAVILFGWLAGWLDKWMANQARATHRARARARPLARSLARSPACLLAIDLWINRFSASAQTCISARPNTFGSTLQPKERAKSVWVSIVVRRKAVQIRVRASIDCNWRAHFRRTRAGGRAARARRSRADRPERRPV